MISTVVMFQAQNRETINSTSKIIQDHYDDERNKTVFHNTTPDLQDQDDFFWSETGLVLRPTVSDHITGSDKKIDASLTISRHRFDRDTAIRRPTLRPYGTIEIRLLLLLLLLLKSHVHISRNRGLMFVDNG